MFDLPTTMRKIHHTVAAMICMLLVITGDAHSKLCSDYAMASQPAHKVDNSNRSLCFY